MEKQRKERKDGGSGERGEGGCVGAHVEVAAYTNKTEELRIHGRNGT